jgi:hypothetical protein
LDFSDGLVRSAASRPEGVPVVRADVRHLPFPRDTLAAAYTVKVLQFLPHEDRSAAIAGLLSVTAPGGRLMLYEKIAGADGSSPNDWIRWANLAGGRLLSWRGNQFVPLDRLFVAIAHTANLWKSNTRVSRSDVSELELQYQHPGLYAVYGRIRELVLWVSLLVEPVLERFAPPSWAEHGIFQFEKT